MTAAAPLRLIAHAPLTFSFFHVFTVSLFHGYPAIDYHKPDAIGKRRAALKDTPRVTRTRNGGTADRSGAFG
jgi:hypothetical protein